MARSRFFTVMLGLGMLLFLNPLILQGKNEPKQTPENTISLKLPEPVKPQTFSRPLKFFVANVIDRTGDARPMLVSEGRGGIFFDRDRTAVVRDALEDSLRAAGMLAPDEASADFLLSVYLFQFGLAEGSGMEIFTKLDMNVVVKSRTTGKSQEVPALGTSIEQVALRKKNLMKRAQASLEECLTTAVRNFLRGIKLREAIETLSASAPQS